MKNSSMLPPGLACALCVVPRGVRRRGAVGARRHGRPGLPRGSRGDYLPRAGRNGLRRAADRRARPRASRELRPERRTGAPSPRPSASSPQSRVAPLAEELDREERFPYELVTELAELGLMGIPIPEEFGGARADTLSYAIAIEELTRIDSSVAITVAAHTSLGTMPIYLFGTEEQKRQWLPPLSRRASVSPPSAPPSPSAGSDAGATRNARRPPRRPRAGSSTARRCSSRTQVPTSPRASRSPRSPPRRDLDDHRPERNAWLRRSPPR